VLAELSQKKILENGSNTFSFLGGVSLMEFHTWVKVTLVICLITKNMRDKAMFSGASLVNGNYIYIRPWYRDFDLSREANNICPITIHFIEVPMELRPIIQDMAFVFGKVMFVTEGKFYNPSPIVKTIVMYDLIKPIVDKGQFIIGDIIYCIKVVFLNVPHTCNYCHKKIILLGIVL